MVLQKFGRPLGAAAKRLKSTLTLPQETGRHGKEFGLTEGFSLDLSLTRTNFGLLVVSLDNYAPVSRVVLAVNSGARFEAGHEQGAGHALRALAYLSTQDATCFGISRTVDINGANSHVTSTREATLYGVDIIRDKLPMGIDILEQIGTKQAFKPWEVEKALPRHLQTEVNLIGMKPHKLAIELAHKAAFRTGLGRSIYCSDIALKKINADLLQDFVDSTFTVSRMAVLGLGVDHDELVDLCTKIQPAKGEGRASPASVFYGNQEVRDEDGSGVANVALLFQGCGIDGADVLTLGVLQRILGAGPVVKYGVGTGRLGRTLASSLKAPVSAGAINANYSDAGVFGIQLTTAAKDAGDAMKVVVDILRDLAAGNITDEEVEAGKKQLKTSIYMASENGADVIEDLAVQALLSKNIVDLVTVAEAIDAVSAADIKTVAAKVLSSPACMGAKGGLQCVPYLDEL